VVGWLFRECGRRFDGLASVRQTLMLNRAYNWLISLGEQLFMT